MEWRLPLWSDELIVFWRDVPWNIKFEQKLYKAYLRRFNPGNLFLLELPKKEIYIPAKLKFFYYSYICLAKLFQLDKTYFKKRFIDYYWIYAPFYPQMNYMEYLKDSKYHRNYLSYYAKETLEMTN